MAPADTLGGRLCVTASLSAIATPATLAAVPVLAPPPPLLASPGPLDPAVAAGAALLVLAALTLIVLQLRRQAAERRAAAEAATRRAREAEAGGPTRDPTSPGVVRAPAELLASADRAAKRGDHERAVRLLWDALVTALDRGRLLAPRPDRDPRTVLIAFRGSPHGRELLETVVGQVEAVCLRGVPADGHRYQLVREAAEQVAGTEGAYLGG